jgi:hypothetical protein
LLLCDKSALYILVADKCGVTSFQDLTPEQQQCRKLREPVQSKKMMNLDAIRKSLGGRQEVACPEG